jgi:hypothetical protein
MSVDYTKAMIEEHNEWIKECGAIADERKANFTPKQKELYNELIKCFAPDYSKIKNSLHFSRVITGKILNPTI